MHLSRTRLLLPFVFLLFFSLSSVSAQSTSPTPTEPNAQGDAAALGARIDALLPPLLAEYGIPGAAVAAFSDGAIVWSQGYGVADEASGTPATADTPFAAWSISKSLTAAAVLHLVEAGQYDLDVPITTYLTSWEIPRTRHPVDQVTTRRILSHTAGFNVDGFSGYTLDEPIPSLVDLLNGDGRSSRIGILQRPGQRFLYSGGGYTVLQLALQDLTGQPFADFMNQTILEPLGMAHSTFVYDPNLGIATSYLRSGDVDPHVIHVAQAAGGLYASVNDLATFYTALMDGEVIAPDDVTQMFAIDPVATFYGMGVYSAVAGDGTQVIFHDGIGSGAQSLFVLFPERREGIVIMTNSANGREIYAETLCAFNAYAITDAPELCIWHE